MSDYVLPSVGPYPAPLEGLALHAFIQAWVVGITGLSGNRVRPRWQAEPSSMPVDGGCWAAVGVATRRSDVFPYVGHEHVDDVPYDTLRRHEQLEVLTSFYDLGFNGQADLYASLLRDGTQINPNRFVLQLNGWGIVTIGDLVAVPVLTHTRWLYRADLLITLSREILRAYRIDDIAEARFSVVDSHPIPPQATGLGNDNGLLFLTRPQGYPTSDAGLDTGDLFNLGFAVGVKGPTDPQPDAAAVYFGSITAGHLKALGGANLPLVQPEPGSLQLWNNGGLVCVA